MNNSLVQHYTELLHGKQENLPQRNICQTTLSQNIEASTQMTPEEYDDYVMGDITAQSRSLVQTLSTMSPEENLYMNRRLAASQKISNGDPVSSRQQEEQKVSYITSADLSNLLFRQ
jgi:hypothetical protein